MGYDWFSPTIWTSSTKWRTDVLFAILECQGSFGGNSPSSHNPKSGESILWVPQELVRSEKNQHSDPHQIDIYIYNIYIYNMAID